VLHLAGLPINPESIEWLIRKLAHDGTDDCREAAAVLKKAAINATVIVALTSQNRAAILSVLIDTPEGLGDLRQLMLRNQAQQVHDALDDTASRPVAAGRAIS
jgi:hypothetical protein